MIFSIDVRRSPSGIALESDQLNHSRPLNIPYRAGFFVGGMKGIDKELEMFRSLHPAAAFWPLASTGGPPGSFSRGTATRCLGSRRRERRARGSRSCSRAPEPIAT